MAKLFDRIGQVTATTGTGTVTLGAVITDATNGDLATFADMGAIAGDSVNYLIQQGNDWEIGSGTLGGTGPGFTLTRAVAKSKIAGTIGTTALTLGGTANVYCVPAVSAPGSFNFDTSYFYGTGKPGDTNYARLNLSHAGGTAGATIATEAGGTGTAGPLTLKATKLQLRPVTPSNSPFDLEYFSAGYYGVTLRLQAGGFSIVDSGGSGNTLLTCDSNGFRANRMQSGGVNGVTYSQFQIFANQYPEGGTTPALSIRTFVGGSETERWRFFNGATGALEQVGGPMRLIGLDGATNYSRLSLVHNGGTAGATITTEAGGTGTAGPLTLQSGSGDITVLPGSGAALQINVGGIGQWRLEGGKLRANSATVIGWTAGWATVGDAIDTALARNAAGVVEINNGTASSSAITNLRDLKLRSLIQAQGTLVATGATTAWDVQAAQTALVTLSIATTALQAPTNAVAGNTYLLIVKQDATGGRGFTFAASPAYKWSGGTPPTLSTAASAIHILTFVYDGTSMCGVAVQSFS